jgi:hypothetical protein
MVLCSWDNPKITQPDNSWWIEKDEIEVLSEAPVKKVAGKKDLGWGW